MRSGPPPSTAVPTRVVALGPADLDAAVALGAPLVGAASSGSGDGISPWTKAALGDAEIEVLAVSGDAMQVNLEQVAALKPDLILAATYYDIDAAYENLSKIAPTTAYQIGPVADSWQQVTEQVGRALGRDDAADELVGLVEGRLSSLADDNPEVDGATFTFGFVTADGVLVLRDEDDVMMTMPAALGMTLSPAVLAIDKGESFAVPVSFEEVEKLDADVLALYDGGDPSTGSLLAGNAIYKTLPVLERDAVVHLDDAQFFAMRQPTVLSVQFLLDDLAPSVVAAATR